MSLQVSSWFVDAAARSLVAPRRRLTLGGSDYSPWVLRWPALAARLESLHLGTATVALSNIDRAFNSLVDGGALLTAPCEIALGLTHPASGTEWSVLFTGLPHHATFARNGAEVRLQVQGKTRTLTDLSLGSAINSSGLDFTTSAYHPADVAWLLVTSHAGFSAEAGSANPDIAYAQWQAWRAADALRDVRVRAYFTGEKMYQALADLARLSGRAVGYASGGFASGRLEFFDVQGDYEVSGALPTEHALEVAVVQDPARLANRLTVEAAYNPATGRYASGITREDVPSQAEFGLRAAGRFASRGVWYATANDARFHAEDLLRAARRPAPALSMRATFGAGLHRVPGEVVTLTHTHLGIAAREFRILAREVDLQEGTLRFDLEPARERPWKFGAEVSTVSVRVRTLTVVASERLLGIEEGEPGGRLLRTDSAGVFQPVGVYATGLLALDGQQVLFGGPPSSDSTQSVLRRSSDGGETSVVVASLGPGTRAVYAFFQPHSGTLIASATSGGLYRSTNAGSSWNLTQTISPGYVIQRFLQPVSGTLWGATGHDNPGLSNGLYLWESVDDGVSWLPRHTVVPSGDLQTGGFHALSGSEFLLGTNGGGLDELNVLRGTLASPTSMAWSVVRSHVSFAEVLDAGSGQLRFGFDEPLTLNGGSTWRSWDAGSSWHEESALAKQGNVRLLPQSGGTLEAYVSRMTLGPRTQRWHCPHPEDLA